MYSNRHIILTLLTVLGTIASQIAFAQSSATSQTSSRVLFILDGSGSMWAPIANNERTTKTAPGEEKISVARRLLTDLVNGLPDDIAPGLQAYGHRREGDCGDVELRSPIALGNRSNLIANILSVRPTGKTPIATSMELAAQTVAPYDDDTVVVLVSDGEENCQRNPCDTVKALREQGARMRVDVIGLDVNQQARTQLRCIARVGGGRYHDASNINQLEQALSQVRSSLIAGNNPLASSANAIAASDPTPQAAIEQSLIPPTAQSIELKEVPAPQPIASRGATASDTPINTPLDTTQVDTSGFNARFVAVNRSTGRPLAGSVEWTLINPNTEGLEVVTSPGNELLKLLPAGRYEVYARSGQASGQGYVDVNPSPLQTYKLKLSDATANTIEAPRSIPAGERMLIGWRGPNRRNDLLFIADPKMDESRYSISKLMNHPTKKGSPAALTAPAQPGNYEIRYFSYSERTVLARSPIQVTAPNVQLSAPSQVAAGDVIDVQWNGPNAPGDRIFISRASQPDSYSNDAPSAFHETRDGDYAKLVAPATPGDYEVRYFSHTNHTALVKRSLQIVESNVTLNAPRTIDSGQAIAVDWSGPDANGDSIVIVQSTMPESRYYLAGSPRVATSKGNPSVINAPGRPGTYEIRYYSELNGRVLARRALIVR